MPEEEGARGPREKKADRGTEDLHADLGERGVRHRGTEDVPPEHVRHRSGKEPSHRLTRPHPARGDDEGGVEAESDEEERNRETQDPTRFISTEERAMTTYPHHRITG